MAKNDSDVESKCSTMHSGAEIENYPLPSNFSGLDPDPQPEPHPLDDEVAALTAKLNSFSALAQGVLDNQPLKTQRKLAKATGEIFRKYEKHGVSARLQVNLGDFLAGKDGTGEKLELELVGEIDESEIWSQQDEWSDYQDKDMSSGGDRGRGKAKSKGNLKMPTEENMRQVLADGFDEIMEKWEKDTGFRFGPNPPQQPNPPAHGTIIDEASRSLANPEKGLPFHPIDTILDYPANITDLPEGLLEVFDHIYGLYALEAHALLKHHTAKYGAHPIFRTGIRELVTSQLEYMFVPNGHHDTGLTHETRTFLRSVFERNSGELNLAEKRMLMRATRCSQRTIEIFWEDLWVRRRAYMGMRAFVAARELKIGRGEWAREAREYSNDSESSLDADSIRSKAT